MERVGQIQTIQRIGAAENPMQLGFDRNWLLSRISKGTNTVRVGYDGFPTVKRDAYAGMSFNGWYSESYCFRPYMRSVIILVALLPARQIRMGREFFYFRDKIPHP